MRDQESLPSLGMKIFFLATVMLAETLDTKQFIAKPMQGNMTNKNDYGYPKDNNSNDRSCQGTANKNYNPLSPLMDHNIVCYKCNKIGYKAQNCRNVEGNDSITNKENPTTIWENEKTSSKEECKLALIAKNKEDEWYIDSGCSTHMTRDQNEFISLKKRKSGSIALGNESTVKILGKGVVNLGNTKMKRRRYLVD
jgi:hypothetical protein